MKNLTNRFKVHQQSTWFKLLLPTYIVLISLLLLTNDTFAQITQVGTATTANNSGTTITITNPAGIQVGDVLLANIVQDDNSGGIEINEKGSKYQKRQFISVSSYKRLRKC